MEIKISHRVLLKETKRAVLTSLMFGAAGVSFSQVYISGTIYNTGNLYCAASLTNAGTFVNTTGGNFYVTGNIFNSGTTAYDGGTLVFAGSTAQSSGGSSTLYTSNASINNAAGVTINKCLSINNTATFVSGLLTTPGGSAEPVEFTSSATPTGVSNASHVNGYVRKLGTGAFTYPVGDASTYQQVAVSPTANATGIVVRYFPANAGYAPYSTTGTSTVALQYYNSLEYWSIIPVSSAAGSVTVFWDAYNNQGIGAASDLRVAHLSGGQWLNEGITGTGSTASGSVTSNAISTWSIFTLGSISNNSPLPIILSSFNVSMNNCQASLVWHAATEVNFNHYELQSSADGISFTTLDKFPAKGNNSTYSYQYTPQEHAMLYYRLKMTDIDGSTSFSRIISAEVSCLEKNSVKVYPIPTSGMFNIDAGGLAVSYSLRDSMGRLIQAGTLNNEPSGADLGGAAAGIYYLLVTMTNGDAKTFKIIKTN